MQKSRLLAKEQPIVISRELAKLIGLNEAIVLQQIEYWINTKEKSDNKNLRTHAQGYVDGYYWTYNTVSEWTEEFPFWSYDTVKRTLKKLRDNNLVVTGVFNDKNYDRTLWYRVNHEKLIEIENNVDNHVDNHVDKNVDKNKEAQESNSSNKKSGEKDSLGAKCTNEENQVVQDLKTSETLNLANSANCPNGLVQNAPMEKCKMPQPIPKTSTKTSTEISINVSSSSSNVCEDKQTLIDTFNNSICQLKNTTLKKFIAIAEKQDEEFINAVIAYCEEQGARAFSYFEKTINHYIEKGITTVDGFENAIKEFKEKSDKKQSKHNTVIPTNEYDEQAIEMVGQDMNSFKEDILATGDITRVSYKAWIKPCDIRLHENKLIIGCENGMARATIEKRFLKTIVKAMSNKKMFYKLEMAVVKK